MREAERSALDATGWGSLFDPLPYLCHDGFYPIEDHGRLLYSDLHHLTTETSRTFAEPLAEVVMRATG